RIHYKMRDYATYRFTAPQSCSINIFFDLAQEFDDLEQIHILSVLILRMFFQYNAELYLKDEQSGLLLVTPAVNPAIVGLPEARNEIWNDDSRCYVPVRGRSAPRLAGDRRRGVSGTELMGVLVLYSDKIFDSHILLFLEKYANRVGFCLHNKILAQRNARHVLFLRKLAHDIGHNIITPNMRVKLMLSQLEGQLAQLKDLCQGDPDEVTMHDARVLQHAMNDQLKNITGSFLNSALFLESLLRQSHFDFGHYVLRLAALDMRTTVVDPQFDRYRLNFTERGLAVDENQPAYPDEPCMVEADLGLISQVLANLLSNAVKYATPPPDCDDDAEPVVRCRVERVPFAFGEADGIKVTVFSTGAHIPEDQARRLFDDSYRAANASGQYGTGHGLFFVSQIVAEHKGTSGYEPVECGNDFFFMLPAVS
ncbi:MAG: HAMP domain-containing histidine kinase, partial [Desulfovibrio sp.]|nr:HAMP domain-containing histidine kinase [Desulfovibrio sp.]